jgi:hypothetical protein
MSLDAEFATMSLTLDKQDANYHIIIMVSQV